jgi:hypothetical protein
MPLVTGIGSPGPVQPTSDAGHSGHTVSGSGTSSLPPLFHRSWAEHPAGSVRDAQSSIQYGGAQSSAQRDVWPSLGGGFQPRHIPLVGSGHPKT